MEEEEFAEEGEEVDEVEEEGESSIISQKPLETKRI